MVRDFLVQDGVRSILKMIGPPWFSKKRGFQKSFSVLQRSVLISRSMSKCTKTYDAVRLIRVSLDTFLTVFMNVHEYL